MGVEPKNANRAFQYIAELKRLLKESKSHIYLKKLNSAALVVEPSRVKSNSNKKSAFAKATTVAWSPSPGLR